MPRRKSVASVDKKIDELKKKISAVQARYDRLCAELTELQAERDAAMGLELVQALKSSGKSYREIMTFLGKS